MMLCHGSHQNFFFSNHHKVFLAVSPQTCLELPTMFPVCVHSHKILPLSLRQILHYPLESHAVGAASFLPQHDQCLVWG